ncbi:hypothetical protein EAS64_27215 [Trebonia kvetii]|uniref:ChsH2 C-terminal OB-fold domain-containing protein n=1 Tax=Trebonia kvetii TaxID=2480626 RepID=A0A6P2BWG1_9ACTN|nr:OB-fold domain-containing protein [Trebonia kvetii]TVZ02485.1 hypothetical protein EAS64_27215 [Trebonia kvetii]
MSEARPVLMRSVNEAGPTGTSSIRGEARVSADGPMPPAPPAPLIDADSAGFWQATREGQIALCRCTGCGAWLARPLERCNRCASPTTFAPVAGSGVIYSYIVVHHPAVPAFAHLVPYVVALVEFDEGPRLPRHTARRKRARRRHRPAGARGVDRVPRRGRARGHVPAG